MRFFVLFNLIILQKGEIMRNFILSTSILLLISCEPIKEENFMATYQREICDKYSLYAKNKDLKGHLSLYVNDATVNNNSVPPIQGHQEIKKSFIEWYDSTQKINHSATVIDAKVFGDYAFAYGIWEVEQVMKDGSISTEKGYWSTHNVKVDNTWKMTLDHTNDLDI